MSMDWKTILKETEEGTRPVPEGEELVRVREAHAKTASTGNEMIVTTVVIEGGPNVGRPIVTNMVFATGNPTAMKMLLRRLTAFGVTPEWLAENNPSISQIASALVGRTAIAQISQREWNKEMRNDITMFTPPAGATPVSAAPAPATGGVPSMTPVNPPPMPEPVGVDGEALGEEEPF